MRAIDIPPLWLVAFLALVGAQARLWPTPLLGVAGDAAGAGLVAAGLALTVAAVVEMRRARTAVMPRREPEALVTSGVFAMSRNPIYLGDALILLGAGLIWDAGLVVVALPLFVLVITRRFIRGEEARLARRFGADFEAWRATTRRWL